MKKLVVLCFMLAGLLAAGVSHAAWNPEWKQRVKIGLNTAADGLPIAAPLDAAPLLIRLHSGNFQFVDAKPDGSDLRIIAGDDTTPLKFHLEKFDGLNELALVWVQLPKLAAGVKTDFIWLYYGNSNAAPAADAKSSYDATQALVYHFSERDGLPQDATAHANHAAASTAKIGAAGLIGGSLGFDGTGTLTLPSAPSLKAAGNGMTLSFWVKPSEITDTVLYAGEGAAGLRLALRGGKLTAQAGAVTATSAGAVSAGAWQHVAVVARDGLVIYLDGQEAGRSAGTLPDIGGAAVVGKGFKGEIDELQVATTARSADWIKLAALSQGPQQKLVSYGPAEGGGSGEEGEPSHIKILLGAVTLDGWVVIAILIVMFFISMYVMAAKAAFVRAATRDNGRFKAQFEKLMVNIAAEAPGEGHASAQEKAAATRYRNSSLYRLYAAGAHELRSRFEVYAKAGREPLLSNQSINAIRATVDASFVRETQRMNSQMVLLTICIAGGPFLGLLGTVVGVMITFAAIAAAGDVNVNAIAPGIAAALVATVAGLAVAIPALFGYNYLTSRISELSSDMEVFIDEFLTRLAENHSM